jgi:hydrophobic/amphiphilic exporter-1 (mainly G- bacteria), HAE1 family
MGSPQGLSLKPAGSVPSSVLSLALSLAPLTVGQLGEVVDSFEKLTRHVRVNGRRGVRVAIRKEADANTVEVSRGILAEVERINAAMPQLAVVPVINQGNFIERSIRNVADSILYGGGLAVLVLLFFLRNIRSTLVISLAIPISVVATFALIFFGGFTLNLMTLGGLALGVGMLVDNSIVVLENIFRWRDEDRADPVAASIGGSREVASAIVASTITTLVVFLPMVFLRGVTGILFRELAFVVMFSLICSLLVSLSLVPMLSSRLLESPEELQGSRPAWVAALLAFSERIFSNLEQGYQRWLQRVIRHPWLTVFAALLLLGGSLLLVPFIGSEFMPPSDEGEVRITGEMEVGAQLEIVDRQARRMEQIVLAAVPDHESYVVSAGSGGWRGGGAPEAQMRLALLPARQRARSNVEIAADLRERLAGQIPGMDIRTRAPQGQFLLNRLLAGEGGLAVELRGYELDVLATLAQRVVESIEDVPGIADLDISLDPGTPQYEIEIDRAKAADLGLSVRDVSNLLETAIAGSRAGEYRSDGNSYRILVQLREADKLSLDQVLDLTLETSRGGQVALRNIVSAREGLGPLVIDRKDQQRIVTIDANVGERALGSVAADVEQRLAGIARPVGYELYVAGDYEEQQESFRELMISLLLALLFVYMVLACQYESFINPLVVMTSVPVAAVGVLFTLFITDTTLNLQSYIGCIMLAGIVVNNAILLVDQSGRLTREDGMAVLAAVSEAGRRRLRPILMTTLTTILALLPLALGVGEGADTQAPLARAVIGGLTGSTLITLLLIPAVYVLFHHRKGDLVE